MASGPSVIRINRIRGFASAATRSRIRGFKMFNELPEDRYEAFLSVPVLCRGRLVAVINLQHRHPHEHSRSEIQLVATVGFLVGAEIELARLESENEQLSERLETRKVMERAKGILQRDLGLNEEDARGATP